MHFLVFFTIGIRLPFLFSFLVKSAKQYRLYQQLCKITSGAILHEIKPELFMIVDFIEYKTIFARIFNVAKPVQLSS